MGDELEDMVGIIEDREVKTPIFVDAGLPAVPGFVIFLGAEGRLMEVLCQELTCLKNAFRTAAGAFSKASLTASLYSTFIGSVWIS
jgi:hypothetical protein